MSTIVFLNIILMAVVFSLIRWNVTDHLIDMWSSTVVGVPFCFIINIYLKHAITIR